MASAVPQSRMDGLRYGRLGEALAAMAPHLPAERLPGVVPLVIATLRGLPPLGGIADALGELAPCLADENLIVETLTLVERTQPDVVKALVFAALAPFAPNGAWLLSWVLEFAAELDRPDDPATRLLRAEMLSRVLPAMPAASRLRLLDEALRAAVQHRDRDGRVTCLLRIAAAAPESRRPAVLAEAGRLATAAAASADELPSISATAVSVAVSASRLSGPEWVPFWRPALRATAREGRGRVVDALYEAAGVIAGCGGPDAVSVTVAALTAIKGWWP